MDTITGHHTLAHHGDHTVEHLPRGPGQPFRTRIARRERAEAGS